MKISNISQIYKTYEAKPAVSGKKVTSGEKKDKLNVSDKAREFQLALSAALNSPSIRDEKVNNIQNQINNNSYNVSAEDVADKILSYL